MAVQKDPPSLVVTTGDADRRIWAEVLNLGGSDVLLKPFNPREVLHAVGSAWRDRQHRRFF